MKILHLFADTNLFLQCHSLEQLDWSEWDQFDEIHLLVCTPVQRQIDSLKNRGNDRLGRRSRKVHSLFRELIINDKCRVLRDYSPTVRLFIEPSYQPDPTLSHRLNYNDVDDRIVGCIHAYRAMNPEADVRLITHDSGPMATAQMLSLPFLPVPDTWIRPPELNDLERENLRLQEENAQLKSTELKFSVTHLGSDENESRILECSWPSFEPLLGSEVASLVNLLRMTFPEITEFGPLETMEEKPKDMIASFLGATKVFVPATIEQINEYTNTKYPKWLVDCEQVLTHLHLSLAERQQPITFSFSIANDGSRPARDSLVKISARGNFLVRPPQLDGGDEESAEDECNAYEDLSFPLPPQAPKGKWITRFGSMSSMDFQAVATAVQRLSDPMSLPTAPLIEPMTLRRDPNEFFYKPNRSPVPSQCFSLECEQWRHGIPPELFQGELCVPPGAEEIRGILEVEIHAENLTAPVKKAVPVRGRSKPFDVKQHAKNMISELKEHWSTE